MPTQVRVVADGELDAFYDAILSTFGDDAADADPGGADRLRALVRPDARWAAVDGAAIVGTAASFDLGIGVPGGGTLPVVGLTMVTVRPTHRRRGLLRELLARHLADGATRAPASALWASEGGIYGRFGYGNAAWHEVIEVSRAHDARFLDASAPDALELVDADTARRVFPPVYAAATADRPGALRRTEAWWTQRRFLEIPWTRKGASRLRHLVARRGDAVVGYAQLRQRPGAVDGLPAGRVEIVELHAVDRPAEVTLWRALLSFDLFPNVGWWSAPVDSALPWLLTDARRVARQRRDNLWLRVHDVPAALAVRSYPRDGELCFAVDGEPFVVRARDGIGEGSPTRAAPALALDRAAFGALYLGGVSASTLARAGRLRGDPRAVALADGLFASAVAPWCPEVF